MISPRKLALVTAIGALACSGERPGASPPEAAAGQAAPHDSAGPKDSLALRTASGIEVWFTAARRDSDTAGRACLERVMEIRAQGRRTPVPLLYTGVTPRLVNDSTIEAAVWRGCRAGDWYRVSLVTGRPVKVAPR
ncbi:MAG TPA: hypothetical protein VMG41_16795 [Gemmatimonadales bacterium]|nr:hypothetical protein [Gemmatimonadales bacterium]